MSSFAKVLIIFGASFVAAILLFLLFDSNEAAVSWGGDAVRLGGPIAGFIATLWITTRILQGLQKSDAEVAQLVETARRQEVADLVGSWNIASESLGDSKRRAVTETRIDQQDGRLRVTGGTFNSVGEDGVEGQIIGDWIADVAVFDGDRLIYMYTLTDQTAGGGVWRGIADARLSRKGGTPRFDGRWQVFGREHHAGTLSMTKS